MTKKTLANLDWYKIACKIRHQNRELKAQISELEQLLSQQKRQINEQIVAREQQDTLIQQQQYQIDSLNAELSQQSSQVELNHHGEEQQQLLMGTLRQELQEVQQQAARLERECSFLQDKYNQQEHLLRQKEQENRQLQVRLQRQQRYNLQYKAALDQYLQSNIDENITPPQNVSLQSESATIKPWNQEQEQLELNSDKSMLQSLTNLEGTLIQSETQIQETINQDIPELIYEDHSNSDTAAKIDKLIEAIDRERERIMTQPHLSQFPQKKLNLPKIQSQESKAVNSEARELNHHSQSINNNNQNNQKLLRLPKFGSRKPN
jgi:hypothetical protein